MIEMTSLLFHISYYSNSKKRVDNKNNIQKSSIEYRNFIIENIKKFLGEIDLYTSFTKKVVVFDINIENTDIYKINFKEYSSIEVKIKQFSFENEHPFRLTTKHRFSMIKEIENFDWFGYSEDDTIITNETIKYIVRHLNSFYREEKKVFTIPRMVYNKKGEYFYSDIIQPSPLRGKCISPRNRFGACWVYSREIMKDWVETPSFFNFNYPNINGGIRVKMGSGFMERVALIPMDTKKKEPLIESVHLGYSGDYYFEHNSGFHTLKKNKLCL